MRLVGVSLSVHPHIRTLSDHLESPFLHKGFASSSHYPGGGRLDKIAHASLEPAEIH